jgi:hypothetical protein
MDRDAVCDYSEAADRTCRTPGLPMIDAGAEPATRRLSRLASLIAVTSLSLAIWAAIWVVLSSLLRG